MAKQYDLAFSSQESWYWRAKCRDAAGNPLDLTGATVAWIIATPSGAPVTSFVSGGSTVSVTNATAGEVAINVPPTTHSNIVAGQYSHVLRVTLASTVVSDQIIGNMTVDSAPISRPVTTNGSVVFTVYNKTDLASADTLLGFVNLISGLASGTFQWQTGNFASLVASDPLQGIYVASSIIGSGSSVGCWVRVTTGGAILPGWFGAVGDGFTDDTATVQAALNAVRNSYRNRNGACENYFDGDGLTYYISSTLDYTGIGFARAGYIVNATFYASFAVPSLTGNNAVLDMTGTNLWYLDRINIEGAKTNSPDYGIVFTRIQGAGEAGRGHLGYVTCHGYFSKACILNYCSEVFSADYLMLANSYPSLTATCLAIFGSSSLAQKYFGTAWASSVPGVTAITGDLSCSNHRIGFIDARMGVPWGPITMTAITRANPGVVSVAPSDLATMIAAGFGIGSTVYFTGISGMNNLNGQVVGVTAVNAGAGTFTLNLDTSAYGAFVSGNVVSQTSPAIIIGNVHHTTIRAYIRVTGNAGLLIDPTAVADGTRSIEFYGRVENGPTVDIYIAGNTATNYIRDLKVKLDISAAFNGQIMSTGVSGGGKISIQKADLSFDVMARTPIGGNFGDPANFIINDADIYAQDPTSLNAPSSFSSGSSGVQRAPGQPPVYFGTPASYPAYTVSTLPPAASLPANSHAFVTDATVSTFGTVVVGGGTNNVPVYTDTAHAWRIG